MKKLLKDLESLVKVCDLGIEYYTEKDVNKMGDEYIKIYEKGKELESYLKIYLNENDELELDNNLENSTEPYHYHYDYLKAINEKIENLNELNRIKKENNAKDLFLFETLSGIEKDLLILNAIATSDKYQKTELTEAEHKYLSVNFGREIESDDLRLYDLQCSLSSNFASLKRFIKNNQKEVNEFISLKHHLNKI